MLQGSHLFGMYVFTAWLGCDLAMFLQRTATAALTVRRVFGFAKGPLPFTNPYLCLEAPAAPWPKQLTLSGGPHLCRLLEPGHPAPGERQRQRGKGFLIEGFMLVASARNSSNPAQVPKRWFLLIPDVASHEPESSRSGFCTFSQS